MKILIRIATAFTLVTLVSIVQAKASSIRDSVLTVMIAEAEDELALIESEWDQKSQEINHQISLLEDILNNTPNDTQENMSILVNALVKKNKLEDENQMVFLEFQSEFSKLRYKKGIDLIKIIYEKILGLDHHFTSLQTHQNISMLSNPNSFPEFLNAKNVIKDKIGKKQAIKLPSIFESNPFVSLTFSLVGSFLGTGDKKNREKDLEKISCILDFTVRMNADLKVVYYESEFLTSSNQTLKEECLSLFKDYTKVIDYKVSLLECRKEDDWENVYESLDNYILELDDILKDPEKIKKAYKVQMDIEFAIDRLLKFIDKYNAFISQGEKYYQKFQTILNNYSNESVCQSQLPHQFNDLKKDVANSISKFDEAYNISELKGSKLKDLIYGIYD